MRLLIAQNLFHVLGQNQCVPRSLRLLAMMACARHLGQQAVDRGLDGIDIGCIGTQQDGLGQARRVQPG